ncbi:MAG: MliC family protein [Candidatus Pacebacteria bacterium]|nr:MliC family protein [Candidatus Paceibacterota bacterium]
MKNYLKIISFGMIVVVFVGVLIYYQKPKNGSLNNNPSVISEETILGTYIGRLVNDVYVLTISLEQGESFTGKLDIKNFEKDSSTGTLAGTYKNGILLADYTFQSEGMKSVGWVAFKKVDGGFIRGFGDTGTEERAQFIDLSKITFDTTVVYKLVTNVINSVVFKCADNKNIKAIFYKDAVDITLSDGRKMLLPQTLSASGARYANFNESLVFWNKGDTAFINEGNTTTYKDCSL